MLSLQMPYTKLFTRIRKIRTRHDRELVMIIISEEELLSGDKMNGLSQYINFFKKLNE